MRTLTCPANAGKGTMNQSVAGEAAGPRANCPIVDPHLSSEAKWDAPTACVENSQLSVPCMQHGRWRPMRGFSSLYLRSYLAAITYMVSAWRERRFEPWRSLCIALFKTNTRLCAFSAITKIRIILSDLFSQKPKSAMPPCVDIFVIMQFVPERAPSRPCQCPINAKSMPSQCSPIWYLLHSAACQP